MATTTLLGYSVMHLRGFPQNVGYDRISLENGQELIITPVVNNKYDNRAAVVKTLDGFIVNRVPKAFTKPCRVMIQTVDVLAMNLQVSFIKLNGTEVKERNGKRY